MIEDQNALCLEGIVDCVGGSKVVYKKFKYCQKLNFNLLVFDFGSVFFLRYLKQNSDLEINDQKQQLTINELQKYIVQQSYYFEKGNERWINIQYFLNKVLSSNNINGLFNRNQNVNPYYYNWNTIIVMAQDIKVIQIQQLQIQDKTIYKRRINIQINIFRAFDIIILGKQNSCFWLLNGYNIQEIVCNLQPYDGTQATIDRRQKQYHKLANQQVYPIMKNGNVCHFEQYLLQLPLYDTAFVVASLEHCFTQKNIQYFQLDNTK
ncbi:unnamed protein product [Paramecium sonneborni]|uniref:Uncharacterized protein n=1 Tax=Paramecium sonneborni TaxID=65129 RepID=A0A8S1RPM5_9CILI|nr:unnamed protein product [Paramecium sonneborni]